MAKTNFTKVEEALAEGLRKMEVNRLLGITGEKASAEKPAIVLTQEQKLLISAIQLEMKFLEKSGGDDPYKKMEISKKEIKRLLKEPTKITAEEWEKLKGYKDKIRAFKEELQKKTPEKTDETFVEKERKYQKTKRFNIHKKWIPLK